MINKLRKKFILYAMISVFLLLSIILGLINIVNFTLLSEDADKITQMISENNGSFGENLDQNTNPNQSFDPKNPGQGNFPNNPNHGSFPNDQNQGSFPSNPNQETFPGNPNQGSFPGNPGQGNQGEGDLPSFEPPTESNTNPENGEFVPGQMGPSSPEMKKSMRYFTVSFDKEGNASIVAFNVSSFSESDTIKLAQSLKDKTTGWVNVTYRYRVYKSGALTYVTVIDQGREMLPSLRVLYASIIGSVVGLIISFIVLLFVSKKLVAPLEEADRKQKRFISDASRELKNPVMVIDADITLIKENTGETDETKSIEKQVRKLNSLAKNLNTLSILNEFEDVKTTNISLSNILSDICTKYESSFEEKNISFNAEIEKNVTLNASEQMIRKLADEILDNAVKYSETYCNIKVYKKENRIYIEEFNDAKDLPSGSLDRIFDRFYRLDSTENTQGTGLGLSIVKEITDLLKGRVYAKGNDGIFELKIEL